MLPLLKHRGLVSHELEIVGRAEAGGTAADDGDALPGGRGAGRRRHRAGAVHRGELQAADIDGRVQDRPAAPALAGMLADHGAGRGEGVVLPDQPHRIGIASLLHQRHIPGNVHASRTVGHTGDGLGHVGGAAMVLHVGLEVLLAALQHPEDHAGSLHPEGAVRGVLDGGGCILNFSQRFHVPASGEHVLDHVVDLLQSDAAWHAFSAGLRPAHLQKRRRQIHRTDARR